MRDRRGTLGAAAEPLSEGTAWLQRWHDRHAGATRSAFGGRRTDSGATTYARLANGSKGRVLDLCCGDGPLLAELTALDCDVVGVDLSSGELAAARARTDHQATLVEASAQALPFPDQSFDHVLCHMALMLLDDLDGALSEVRRVLRPGGELRAVVGRGASESPNAWSTLVHHLRPLSMDRPPLGDPRCGRDDTLEHALLSAGFSVVHTERWEFIADDSPEALWRFFELSYDHEPLQEEEREALKAAVMPKWHQVADRRGVVPCRLALCCVRAVL